MNQPHSAAGRPAERWDSQGDLDDRERVEGAMRGFAHEYGAVSAMYLDACIHCGMCADACHYYVNSGDPEYTPIRKAEPFKQAYKREAAPLGTFYRWFRLKKPVTADQLGHWQHLLYDSCNLCGRCSLICPMGIDVCELIEQGRRGMFEAGLAPEELYEGARRQRDTGSPLPGPSLTERLKAIEREYGIELPMDRRLADVMVCLSRNEIEHFPKQIVALVRILEHLGVSWTVKSEALLGDNYGYLAGSRDWQYEIAERVIDEAAACQASSVLLPECGHAYTALRWEAAELGHRRLPFRVYNVTEYLAERLRAGELGLGRADGGPVTFHDPCQIARRGGVEEAPRELLEAMGIELHEMYNSRGFAFCCGGGGGVQFIERASELRHRAAAARLEEADATGADRVLTACAGCRWNFNETDRKLGRDRPAESLVELVSANLA